MSEEVLMYAVGDIGPSRPDPDTLFDFVRPTLTKADVAFMQLELPISERGARLPQVRHTDRTSRASAAAFRRAGFSVVSFASNHCMDWGARRDSQSSASARTLRRRASLRSFP
jgi:poly-gamma-glutamate capsule biosynthesis protein CapA/YwtB (metallophosphatase superfamily)